MRVAILLPFMVAALTAAPAFAQLAAPAPPGPFAVDLRGVTMASPDDLAFFPPLPSGTARPSRGFGFEIGGHVYLMRVGAGRLGVGGSLVRLSAGTAPPEPVATPTSVPPPRTIPDVDQTVIIMSPQVSLNFGNAGGWSYVSAGYGTGRVRSTTSGIPQVEEAEQDSGRLRDINVGGGARWFTREHVAFSFDIRIHMLGAGSTPAPLQATPAARLIAASVGISLR